MELKKIYTKHFPKKGYTALTVCPYVFVREDERNRFTKKVERHETTHALQQIEMLVVGVVLAVILLCCGYGWYSLIPIPLFFELYFAEWLIKIPFCRFDTDRAYMSISTEQEAYEHQDEFGYNNVRKHFNWIKFIFTLTPKKS